MFLLGQTVGVLSAIVVLALLALMVLAPPYAPVSGTTIWALVPTALLAVLVVVASLWGSPVVLMVAFGISFVPSGLYLLFTTGVFSWVGAGELGYLLAAILLYFSDRSKRRITNRCL